MKAIGRFDSRRLHAVGAVALGAALLLGASGLSVARAADLGGDCCADLEERVAELEQTTVRKGNRRVSVTLSGLVNRALMYWDDGDEQNLYEADNINDETAFQLEGDATIRPGWQAGFLFLFKLTGTGTDSVNQLDDDGGVDGDQNLIVDEANWWLESERLGRLTVGRLASALDGVPEVDLSGAEMIAYSGVADIGGGFFLRRSDIPGTGGLITGITWGDLIDHLNGPTNEGVRYDSPEFGGFTLAASWGEDDYWDVSLSYALSLNSIELEASIGYGEDTDNEPDPDPNTTDPTVDAVVEHASGQEDNETLVGSISVLHKPSGINLTFAAGRREFNYVLEDNDGVLRTPKDVHFYYAKVGKLKRYNALGETAFYGEWGQFEDFLSVGGDAEALDLSAAGACAAAGVGCLVTGSEAEIWGVGVVQYIENAAMQLYIGYRHYDVDIDLVDVNLAPVATGPLEDFDVITVGGRIEF